MRVISSPSGKKTASTTPGTERATQSNCPWMRGRPSSRLRSEATFSNPPHGVGRRPRKRRFQRTATWLMFVSGHRRDPEAALTKWIADSPERPTAGNAAWSGAPPRQRQFRMAG
jgi:hypothetical protein